jgi:hypothetical protein
MCRLFLALLALHVADRQELRDHAFGDREIHWTIPTFIPTHPKGCECLGAGLCSEGVFASAPLLVASGYVGRNSYVSVNFIKEERRFFYEFEDDQLARDAAHMGKLVRVDRNDSMGEEY